MRITLRISDEQLAAMGYTAQQGEQSPTGLCQSIKAAVEKTKKFPQVTVGLWRDPGKAILLCETEQAGDMQFFDDADEVAETVLYALDEAKIDFKVRVVGVRCH
ncbi:hypothetical protein [Ferrimonas marina]|uniref:Uncharacterized protein n=1 Tax=Ferrimonas marina TaxID=299255 RepID=A0A1M5TMY7_9GAMM|nr:hypothetical protein [Ferrimonas marina]SHH51733.1 hypothetical protein SAMN02745129_2198 [Ferrimonas marina]